MPNLQRNAIDIKDARIAVDGRTITPSSVQYTYETPQSSVQAIGALIQKQDGQTRASFSFEHEVTQEDIDLLLELVGRETPFEITGRIPRGDNTFSDIIIPNCKLGSRGLNIQVGSTTSFSGECQKMRVL